VLNAIFYVCGEGIKWRALPKEQFPPGRLFTGIFPNGAAQAPAHRPPPLPATLVIDSQTVKNMATATTYTGTNGGKRIKGCKRMLLIDIQGNLLAVKVFEPDRHDGPVAAKRWQQSLMDYVLFKDVGLVKADHHFGGVFKSELERNVGIGVEVSAALIDKAAQQKMAVHQGR
jgi:hypothetical protein